MQNPIQQIRSFPAARWRLALVAACWLVFTGLVLAACGPAPRPSPGTPAGKPAATATLPATKRPTQTLAAKATEAGLKVDSAKLSGLRIRFGYAWAGKVADAFEKLAAEFNATNSWGIWVTAVRSD